MLNKTTQIAIKATKAIILAQASGKRLGYKEIASEIKSSESFTAKILQKLSSKGIINSQKGPNGGFFISKKVDILEIFSLFDPILLSNKCLIDETSNCCSDSPCFMHTNMAHIREEFSKALQRIEFEMET